MSSDWEKNRRKIWLSNDFKNTHNWSDGKIALVGYYEFVAQHFQKVSKSSKKVQKYPSGTKQGAKAPLLETLFVYVLLMMSGCQNKVEIREILNIIIFKKDCGLLQWNYPCQIELNRK